MSERPQTAGVEGLLADALQPIEPPERFSTRVESTLSRSPVVPRTDTV